MDSKTATRTSSNTGSVQVNLDVAGRAWVTIDRAAKHNALARPVLAELAQCIEQLARQEDLRLIVLSGAGDRYFAAGGDLKDLASVRDEAATAAMMDEAGGALDAIRLCPVPVIAYLNGDAIGGGAELALACDMRVLASHARIGFIQARLAITSAWGGGPDLFRLIGPSRAMSMMARAELVDARQALAWGLADAVVSDGPEGADLDNFLAPMQAFPAQVLRGIKAQAIAARHGADWAAHRRVEREHLIRTWLHDDHWAAADKLLSKASR